MSFSLSSPVTGATISGLTAPTYTLVADTAPSASSKQFAVSALGGTQSGVSVHTIGSPFTITMFRPSNFKTLGQPNNSGVIKAFPKNTFEILVRKGVGVLANQPIQLLPIRISIPCPAGVDTYDAVSLKAALSLAFGALYANASIIADTCITGTL